MKPRKMKPQLRPHNYDSVVVAYIHPGQVSALFTRSLLETAIWDRANGRRIKGMLETWSSANVAEARNSLTRQFVEDYDADWLLWVDSDMVWQADALERLVASAHPETAPIVGGLCFGASDGQLFPTIYQAAEIDGKVMTIRQADYPRDEVVQCIATGAAFLLIHRSVLVKVRDAEFNLTFPWFQETEISGRPAGEDLTFCLRAGQLGIPVHVNTAVKIGHHKSNVLTEDLFLLQRSEATADDVPVRA